MWGSKMIGEKLFLLKTSTHPEFPLISYQAIGDILFQF